ncbi:GAF domain-containing protein [Patescibacteria group bacterium]|nr:GAF domain-containing protein [Patescibacteria group bacterium]
MSIFGLSSLVTLILSLIIGIFVIWENPKSLLNRSWFFVSICASLWALGLLGVVESSDESVALKFQYLLDVSGIFIPIFFLLFTLVLLDLYKIKKNIFKTFFLFGFVLAILSFTPLFKGGVSPKFNFNFWIDPGPLYLIFPLFFSISVIFSVYLMLKKYKSLTGLKKQQVIYILLTALFGFGGGTTNFFPQLINTYPFGNFFVIFYVVAITYAIAKYRLMDIRLVISRSILYFLLILIVALTFTFITFTTGQLLEGRGEVFVTLLVSLIIVVGLDPLKKLLARLSDSFFYRGKIDYQEVLRDIGGIIASELDLHKLTERMEDSLQKEIKVRQARLYLCINHGEQYFCRTDGKEKFFNEDLVIKRLLEKKEMIITEELGRQKAELKTEEEKEEIDQLQNKLDEQKLGLVMPIMAKNKVTAVLCIGQKLSGSPFMQDEIDFFEILAPQIATALEKSKLFEEVQTAKLNLEYLVKQRTADLEERNRYLVALQGLINVITRSLDFQKVMQTIADGINTELGYIGGILNFVNPKTNTVSIGAISNTPQIQKVIALVPQDVKKYSVSLAEPGNLAMQAIVKKEIISGERMHDFFKPAIPEQLSEKIQEALGAKAVLAVPVYTEENIIGVIDFVLAKPAVEVTKVEKEMMKSLANQVGIVFRNLTLYQKIQQANIELKEANVRLQQLDKAKSEFLSIASHQLRTPLTGIKGYLSMILEGDYGPVPSGLKTIIENLSQNTDRLTRLVNIFLNVSRIESGRFELVIQEIDLIKLLEEVITEFKPDADKKNLELHLHLPAKLLPHISLDRDKIKDVVVNMIDNSIKYTPEGRIDVFVEAGENQVKVMVKDTGVGIKEGEVNSLFKKFVRGEGIAQIHTGGSGLGLYIAKNIIEAHGGKIWAESAGKGKGSAFIFTLPIH